MAVTLTHAFVSSKPEGSDPTKVRTSNWNEEHDHNIDAEIAAAEAAAEAAANSYTDGEISTEIINRNAAISSAISTEVTDRDNAIAAATSSFLTQQQIMARSMGC